MFKTPSLANILLYLVEMSRHKIWNSAKAAKYIFFFLHWFFMTSRKAFLSRAVGERTRASVRRALPALSRIVSPPSLFSFCSLFLFFFFFVWNGHFFKVATRRKQFKFFFSLSKSLLLSLSLSLSRSLSLSLSLSPRFVSLHLKVYFKLTCEQKSFVICKTWKKWTYYLPSYGFNTVSHEAGYLITSG